MWAAILKADPVSKPLAIDCKTDFSAIMQLGTEEVLKFDPYHDADGKFTSKDGAQEFGKAASSIRNSLKAKSTITGASSTENPDGSTTLKHSHQFFSKDTAAASLPEVEKAYHDVDPSTKVTLNNSKIDVEHTVHLPLAPALPEGRTKSDDEIIQKIKDDRLLSHFYGNAGFPLEDKSKFKALLEGLSPADRLKYVELNAQKKDIRSSVNPESKTDVPAEFGLKFYAGYSKDEKVPKGLTADGIRDYLKGEGAVHTAPVGSYQYEDARVGKFGGYKSYTQYPEVRIDDDQLLAGLNQDQKMQLASLYPQHLATMDAQRKYGEGLGESTLKSFMSTKQIEDYADSVEAKAKEIGKDVVDENTYDSNLENQRNNLWKYTENYEVARRAMFEGWAISGGTDTARTIRYAAKEAFPVNQGKQFFNVKNPLAYADGTGKDPASVYSPRLIGHLQALKAETEQFYQDKFKTKKDPTPDLSQKPLTVMRGVGGYPTQYMPAAAESWTTDKYTPIRFGKMMAEGARHYGSRRTEGSYTVLTTPSDYSHVLWSYQSAAGKPGWPPDKDLKGKKEFVMLGGALKDIDAKRDYEL